MLELPFMIDDRNIHIAASSGIAVYPLDGQIVAHLQLAGELRHAIAHDERVLHFQPKINLRIGKTIGVEALVRWQHPKQGLVPPNQFIPAAEATELIKPLTRWVLNRALQQSKRRRTSAQGFHVCPPIVAADLTPWLRHSAWGVADRIPPRRMQQGMPFGVGNIAARCPGVYALDSGNS